MSAGQGSSSGGANAADLKGTDHTAQETSGQSEDADTASASQPKKPSRPVPFAKECVLSPELAAFLGKDRMSRSDVVSAMWRTIRQRGLIDPNQKQFAICDADLLKIIGKKRFKVFGMMKYLKNHIRDAPKPDAGG